MAISQSSAQVGVSVGMVKKKRGDIEVIEFGGVDFCVGNGAPASADMKASPKGSIYIDAENAKPYIKTSAAGVNTVMAVIGSIES